jgi:NHLM bacteriocin system ABC transporter peptidase/ATP-binding protein
MEWVECGAACLAMVLGAYGRFVPLEELRLACGVSRDGTKASNILRAAERYGLRGKGYSKEPAALRALPLPLIVFWNFNHFVVIEGFERGRVLLNDPATGPRTVDEQEFDQSFTGVVLVFQPGPGFRSGGQRSDALRALRPRLQGAESALLLAALAGLGVVLTGLVVPALTQRFVDDFLVGGSRAWLGPILLGIAAAALLRATFTWLEGRCLLRIWSRLSLDSSQTLFWHVLGLPMTFFVQRYPGEIAARVGLNDRLARLLSLDLARALLDAGVVAAYGLLMLRYDLLLTLIAFASAALSVVVLRRTARRHIDLSRRYALEAGLFLSASLGGLQIVETLKATGAESDFFTRWAGYQARLLRTQLASDAWAQALGLVPALLSIAAGALVLLVGALRIMAGDLTVGQLVAFQVLLASFLLPIERLVGLGGTFQIVQADLERLDDVLRYPAGPLADPPEPPANPLTGLLEVRGLTFGYSPLEPPLIQDLQLTLRPGARVALVGGSGSGKSTVARLICGLYQPWSGQILLDGRPRAAYSRQALASAVGWVDQDILLFEGTIRQNLTLWDPAVDDQRLQRAARDACLEAEILARPGGLDSPVLEGGANFSGGQRQRLEIARALVGDPSLLVLDEATSALDPLTEQAVLANLARRGCACLLVAHRLSTIREADEIVVLEQGRVVERGRHDRLLARGGAYAALVAAE